MTDRLSRPAPSPLTRATLGRRRFLGLAGAAAGLGVVAACGESDDSGGGTASPAGTGPASSPAAGGSLEPDGDLVYFNYAEYLDPEAIAGFEAEYGVTVQQNNFDTYDSMFALMQENSYDVVFPNGEWVSRLIAGDLLAPVNLADLPNASNVDPFFQSIWYDPDGTYSAPYNFYKNGLLVRTTDLQGVEVASWADMLDPGLAGLVYMFDDVQAGIQLGLQLAGRDINSVDPADVDAAVEELIKLKANLGAFTTDFNQPLVSGEGAVTYSYNGAAAQVRNQVSDPENIAWVNPSEGVIAYSDAMVIPANAEHPNTARLFIDWMLRPDVSAANVAFTGYSTGTTSGIEAFTELYAAEDPEVAMTVDDLKDAADAGLLSQDVGVEGRAVWDEAWTRVKLA